jgi:hypothetical protein
VRQLLAGEVPCLGHVMEVVKEVKLAFQAAQNVQKRLKNDRFSALIDFKNAKRRRFLLKRT